MTPLGDRRSHVRLEVVGSLRGTLEVTHRGRVANLSEGGALLVCPAPLAVDASYPIALLLDGREIRVHARVRHVTRAAPSADGSIEYRIGVAFDALPAALVQALD